MTNSPFSFHCFVCYEEFDAHKRYPVIFPCGHTYVCNMCADRLDRCYECRTPLSMVISKPSPEAPCAQAPGSPYSSRRNFRSIHNRAGPTVNKQPPPPPVRQRLPLPKNIVLLSLMEATELAVRDVQSQEESAPGDQSVPSIMSTKSLLDPEEEEEEKIKVGTTLAISDCGTYAVAAKDGMDLYPNFPSSLASSSFQEASQEDSLIRVFKHENSTDENSETGSKEQQPARLRYGDRVQIVSLDNGWAKLARGYGYARADKNKLVKVGGSVDRACKLEALLRRLSNRRKELKADQMKVDNDFIALMNDLQVSLGVDEDLTVITADTFHKKNPKFESSSSPFDEDESVTEGRDNTSSPQPTAIELRVSTSTDTTPTKPQRLTEHRVPATTGYFCSGADVLETMIPACSEDDAQSNSNSSILSASASTPTANRQITSVQSTGSTENRPSPLMSSQHPSPNALRAGARAWREIHGRKPSSSTGIDFRTGLSGHTALLSSSAQSTHGAPSRGAGIFRSMSNHSGLTMSKVARRILQHPIHLNMPAFGAGDSSPSREAPTIAETSSIASS